MSSYVEIKSHNTPRDLYDNFARVFGTEENGGVEWVTLTVDGVKITLFPEPVAVAVAS